MGQWAGRSKAKTARALIAYSCAVMYAPAVHLIHMACMCKLTQSTKLILPVVSALVPSLMALMHGLIFFLYEGLYAQ